MTVSVICVVSGHVQRTAVADSQSSAPYRGVGERNWARSIQDQDESTGECGSATATSDTVADNGPRVIDVYCEALDITRESGELNNRITRVGRPRRIQLELSKALG